MLLRKGTIMKLKKQWSIDFLQQKKSKLGHAEGVTYRMASNLRRLPNGQLVNITDKLRSIRGKNRKACRAILRADDKMLERKGLV
jgi:hypothetical protein